MSGLFQLAKTPILQLTNSVCRLRAAACAGALCALEGLRWRFALLAHEMRLWGCLAIALIVAAASCDSPASRSMPVLQYTMPAGFNRGQGEADTWIAKGLDGVIHVYPFRSFHGNFGDEFHRTLFRDWIAAPYREDKRLDGPAFHALNVKGATAAMTAAFRNFNAGVPREHLRVAVLASGKVALVDVSANSPETFERNRPSFLRLLTSLRVIDGGSSDRPASSR
jgi:hypothetical protein